MSEYKLANNNSRSKLQFLDSLRGLMAINVMLCHFVIFYFPQTFYEAFAKEDGGFLSLFYYTPLSVLVNGNIAVQYFFVLTGFLVGRSIFTKKNTAAIVAKKCVNRYFRLLPVIIGATVLSLILLLLNLHHHHEIAEALPYTDLVKEYWNFKPGISQVLRNIFIMPFYWGSQYVGPFWTIPYEFFGYIIAMVLCYFVKNSKWRRLIYIACAGVFHFVLDNNYIVVLLGVLVADLYYNCDKDATVLSKWYADIIKKKWFVVLSFFVGTYFSVCPMTFTTTHKILKYVPLAGPGVIRGLGMAMVVFSFLYMPGVQKFLSNRVFNWMGKISFSVYAFHWPVMLTVQAALFDAFSKEFSYNISAVLAFLITLPVIYLVAFLAWRLIEKNKNYDIFRVVDFIKNKTAKKATPVEAED